MVLLHVKKGEESLFLHSCTLDDPVSEVSISHFLLLLVHTTNSLHTKDTGSLRMHHSSNPHALAPPRCFPNWLTFTMAGGRCCDLLKRYCWLIFR